jgi:hypothetical protein
LIALKFCCKIKKIITSRNYRNRRNKGDVVLKYNIGDDEQFGWGNDSEGVKWKIKNLCTEMPSKLKVRTFQLNKNNIIVFLVS